MPCGNNLPLASQIREYVLGTALPIGILSSLSRTKWYDEQTVNSVGP